MTAQGLASAVAAASSLDLDRVPNEVLAHAGRVIADTVAVIVAGARASEVTTLASLESVGPTAMQTSTALTSPTIRMSAPGAAFINATAGTFLELDEGMRPTGHPAMQVLPAALAVAECERSNGEDLLRAFLAGYEVASRLFRAFRLRYPVHPHGHFGAVGAAVACALLEDVSPLEAARIAATTPLLPVWDACFDGATARNTYTGWAAQSGVRSCTLARSGFTGSWSALQASFGDIAGELVDESALSADLSYSDLGITRNYFKRHSTCALSHAAIDAVLELEPPPAQEIEHVVVETVNNNMKLARQPQANNLSGRFSLPYAVATAIVVGRTDPEACDFKPDVAEFAKRVHVRVAPDLEEQWPQSSPARVTVHSYDGVMAATVENPRGHHSQPFTGDQIHEKFLQLVDSSTAEDLWARLTSLSDQPDCSAIFTERAP